MVENKTGGITLLEKKNICDSVLEGIIQNVVSSKATVRVTLQSSNGIIANFYDHLKPTEDEINSMYSSAKTTHPTLRNMDYETFKAYVKQISPVPLSHNRIDYVFPNAEKTMNYHVDFDALVNQYKNKK